MHFSPGVTLQYSQVLGRDIDKSKKKARRSEPLKDKTGSYFFLYWVLGFNTGDGAGSSALVRLLT